MIARVLPTAALLLLVSCSDSFDPTSRPFDCATEADCSSGFTCHPVSRVCVLAGQAATDNGGPAVDIPPPWEQDGAAADPGGPEPWDGSYPSDPIHDPDDGGTDMDYPWPEELPTTCGDGFCNGDESLGRGLICDFETGSCVSPTP